jgi:tRNA(fMet)-specific endonuclease VapC
VVKVRPKYLLDTNMISEPVKAVPNRHFLQRFEQYEARLAISAVTWHEALYGAELLPDGKRKRAVTEYLRALALPVLPYDDRAAEWFAKERARLKRSGRPPPYADGQIAAIAAVNELTIVTANKADFLAFDDLEVTNWMR